MNNKKGQALVEFVLILPIIIMILFVVIDFASIFYNKNHLEGILNDVATSYDKNLSSDKIKTIINNDDVTYTIDIKGDLATIRLEQNVQLITPFSSVLFQNPFVIATERTIFYE